MFYYLDGTLTYTKDNFCVIDCAGVGYQIFAPLSTLGRLPGKGSKLKLFTHVQVREDIFDLYGFLTEEELSTFKMLITVSGVGPKVGMSILSELSPSTFAASVVTGDAKTLTSASGVGPKMAQRIILELKDKLKNADLVPGDMLSPGDNIMPGGGVMTEAIRALMVLGYQRMEAERAAKTQDPSLPLEEIIKGALKRLMKA